MHVSICHGQSSSAKRCCSPICLSFLSKFGFCIIVGSGTGKGGMIRKFRGWIRVVLPYYTANVHESMKMYERKKKREALKMSVDGSYTSTSRSVFMNVIVVTPWEYKRPRRWIVHSSPLQSQKKKLHCHPHIHRQQINSRASRPSLLSQKTPMAMGNEFNFFYLYSRVLLCVKCTILNYQYNVLCSLKFAVLNILVEQNGKICE